MVREVSPLQEKEIRGLNRAQPPPLMVLLFLSWSFDSQGMNLQLLYPGGEGAGFPGGADKNLPVRQEKDLGSIPGSGRSPGEGNGYPLQYPSLEIPWTEEPGRLQSVGCKGSASRLERTLFQKYYSSWNTTIHLGWNTDGQLYDVHVMVM